MKKKRHELILKLIRENSVTTQEELLDLLKQNGFDVTQATVSRDIKELKLIKSQDESGLSKYCVVSSAQPSVDKAKFYTIFSQSVISIDYAGHMCIIKCYAGTANAAGAAIDSMHIPYMLGTLAGDDTLFVLCRSEEAAKSFTETIRNTLNGD